MSLDFSRIRERDIKGYISDFERSELCRKTAKPFNIISMDGLKRAQEEKERTWVSLEYVRYLEAETQRLEKELKACCSNC